MTPAPALSLTSADALVLLATMESLGLAALSIGVLLATPVEHGWGVSRRTVAGFAFAATGVLAVLAVAAGLVWAQIFLPMPDDWSKRIEAGAIFLGFVAQPFFAFVISIGVWD